jgi:muramoyltetrapeptide carboxypeptidase
MIPYRLKIGDTIGIVSPSDPIPHERKEYLENSIRYLQEFDFEVKAAKNALKKSLTPKEKGEDINEMFSDTDVKAVLCSYGGNTAEQCLDYIDWKNVEKNPKIFIGFSDNTVPINAIHKKTGLVTFHGPDLISGFGEPSDYFVDEFCNRLVKGKIGKIPQNKERKCVRPGIAEGELVGGNVRCLLKLADTEYWPDMKDSILFLESYTATPQKSEKYFNRLMNLDVFDKINGAAIGYVYGLQATEERLKLEQMEKTLDRITKDYNFPILKVNDFGHFTPNTVLPVGTKARIDADKEEIEILERCVK